MIFFDVVETDEKGFATVEFTLNDSITSFRITVHAVDENVDVGINHKLIHSSLPLSISFTELRGVKATDEVVLNAYSLGNSKDPVHYVFSLEGVEKVVETDAKIGETVFASFGQLPVGEYKATITATSGKETDKVKFPIRVVKSQTEIFVRNTFSMNSQSKIKPTKNPIILELYRSSFKDYEEFLNIISETKEERFDTRFSYMKAQLYENRYLEEKNVAELGDISIFKGDTGWKFLNAEQVSYPLTAIASYYDKDLRFDKNIYYNMIKDDSLTDKLNGYVVLAAMKEPILDDIRFLFRQIGDYSEEEKEKLILSALFLGDYNTVRNHYTYISDNKGLQTYVSTFVNKNKSSQMIKQLYASDIANRYLYFSIISYFENNYVELDEKEDVTVSYGNKKEKVELNPLGKKKLVIYQDNLKDLKLKSKYSDIYYNYYYEGGIDEIDDSLKQQNINMRFDNENPSVGDNVKLIIDISKVPRNSMLKIYLPNGLRLEKRDIGNGVYISSNKIDYCTIYIGKDASNELQIPLFASSKGAYEVEPIVLKMDDNNYLLSNAVRIKIK